MKSEDPPLSESIGDVKNTEISQSKKPPSTGKEGTSHGICLNSGLFKASYGEALHENTCEIEFCD